MKRTGSAKKEERQKLHNTLCVLSPGYVKVGKREATGGHDREKKKKKKNRRLIIDADLKTKHDRKLNCDSEKFMDNLVSRKLFKKIHYFGEGRERE